MVVEVSFYHRFVSVFEIKHAVLGIPKFDCKWREIRSEMHCLRVQSESQSRWSRNKKNNFNNKSHTKTVSLINNSAFSLNSI